MKRLNKYVTRDQDAHHASSICRRVKGRPRSEDPKISIMCQAPLTRHDLQMTTAWGLGTSSKVPTLHRVMKKEP